MSLFTVITSDGKKFILDEKTRAKFRTIDIFADESIADAHSITADSLSFSILLDFSKREDIAMSNSAIANTLRRTKNLRSSSTNTSIEERPKWLIDFFKDTEATHAKERSGHNFLKFLISLAETANYLDYDVDKPSGRYLNPRYDINGKILNNIYPCLNYSDPTERYSATVEIANEIAQTYIRGKNPDQIIQIFNI